MGEASGMEELIARRWGETGKIWTVALGNWTVKERMQMANRCPEIQLSRGGASEGNRKRSVIKCGQI